MTHRNEHKNFIFYTLCLVFSSVGMVSMLPGTALPFLASQTNVSLDIAGWVLTSSSIGYTFGVILAGQLSKRLGPRYLLMTACALLAIASPVIPMTHIFWILLLAQFTVGIGSGIVDVSINHAMTLTFTDTLGEMLNKLHSSFGIGALTGPLLLSLVLAVFHEAAWAFIIGMTLAILALILLTFMRLPTQLPAPATQPTTQRAAGRSRSIFMQLALWLLALQLFLYVGGEVSFGGWITSALSQAATIPLAEAAPAATLFWLGLTLGRLAGGQILKREWLSEKALLYLCFFGGFVSGLFAAVFIGNIWIAFAGSLFIGIFCAPIFPGVMAIASRRFADSLSSASTVILVGSGSSGFVFPPLVGVVLTHVGIGWSLLIPALLLLAIALPFMLVKPETREIASVPGETF